MIAAVLGALRDVARPERTGVVSVVDGLRVTVRGVEVGLGDTVLVGEKRIRAEVVATSSDGVTVIPVDRVDALRAGDPVRVPASALARPIGSGPAPRSSVRQEGSGEPQRPSGLRRRSNAP